MDISSTLIGVILLLLFIGPVFILIINQNRKDRSTKRLLEQKIKEYGINPDISELTPSLLLGLDSNLKKLLIVRPISQESNLISLAEIKRSQLRIVDKPELPGKVNFISLDLLYNKKDAQPFEIVFYDEEDDANPEAEVQLQLARRWENHIKEFLSS
ncbi:MAG TPA: hypothetical protein VLN72_06600 [Gillisia sp.]|nr:hypothetical protein [Gillisia sp.]